MDVLKDHKIELGGAKTESSECEPLILIYHTHTLWTGSSSFSGGQAAKLKLKGSFYSRRPHADHTNERQQLGRRAQLAVN